MGWGSGSRLMREVIRGLNEQRIPETLRASFYKILIPAMRDRDWDTETECMGIDAAYDSTLREMFPDWFTEE